MSAGPGAQWFMRFGVLGPLRVEVCGEPVDVGGPVPRRILAALVAHAGEVVSVGALVVAVWGDAPPASAVKTLRAHVARLRSALGDTGRVGGRGSGVIVTVPPGYRLEVAADAVDAVVFVDRIRQARRAVDAGRAGEADRLLDEAFGLWRGPPFGEFADTDFGAAEALRLGEVRLAGLETRLDAALLAGRHVEVIAEAEGLCGRYPLRERFWAQLMTALYRSGRQADALAAFQRLRTQLAEEIGADPGPALRLVEQQVLRQDEILDPPAPAPASAMAPTSAPEPTVTGEVSTETPVERRVATVVAAAVDPIDGQIAALVGPGTGRRRPAAVPCRMVPSVWNVPRRNPAFTGREALLAGLRQRLQGGRRATVQALHGMGGVGKTQLAIEYAHLFAGDYRLVWWVDAERPELIAEQVAALAVRAGWADRAAVTAVAVDAAWERLRRADRWLLVFDNVESAGAVQPWLPPETGHVIITARGGDVGRVGGPGRGGCVHPGRVGGAAARAGAGHRRAGRGPGRGGPGRSAVGVGAGGRSARGDRNDPRRVPGGAGPGRGRGAG